MNIWALLEGLDISEFKEYFHVYSVRLVIFLKPLIGVADI